MARTARIINVPKPGPKAFDKKRIAGHLLRSQSLHLRHALSKYVHETVAHLQEATELLTVDLGKLKTEGDVGEYAKKVMAILHPQAKKVGK